MQIKQLKVFEITLELNKVSSAVNKAVYSKSSTDINDAKKLVLAFYDLPIREELIPVQLLFRRKIKMKLKRQKTSWTHIFFVLKI